MKRSVFWALVIKDLYIHRGFMVAMGSVGLAAWATMGLGGRATAVGGVLFLTANVAGAIFMAMHSLLVERREQARLFALSLPISGIGYDTAKVVSTYLAFGIPWLLLTVVGLLGILMDAEGGRGMFVYGLLIQCFVLALFSVVLAALFAVATEAMSGLVILGVNICFSIFMMQIHQDEITAPWKTGKIVWTPFARGMLAGELIVTALALASVFLVMSRRRDHV